MTSFEDGMKPVATTRIAYRIDGLGKIADCASFASVSENSFGTSEKINTKKPLGLKLTITGTSKMFSKNKRR